MNVHSVFLLRERFQRRLCPTLLLQIELGNGARNSVAEWNVSNVISIPTAIC